MIDLTDLLRQSRDFVLARGARRWLLLHCNRTMDSRIEVLRSKGDATSVRTEKMNVVDCRCVSK